MEDQMLEEGKMNGERSKSVTNYVALPPDGGWGWVVVAASFFCNMVIDGIVFSFGALLVHVAEEFNISTSQATITGSLLSGFYLISGPFVSAISNRYGFRMTGIVGSVIGCAAFAAASVAPTIETLWLFYGVIGGIGFGMIYVPAVITTGFYFEKLRALATGISVTGSGIGTAVIGPIIKMLIDSFGWRGAVLVLAGIILNCAVFSSMYRPLKRIHIAVDTTEEEDGKDEQTRVPLLQRIKIARDKLRNSDSVTSLDDEVGITAIQPPEANKFLRATNNKFYPRAIEALNENNRESLEKSIESFEMKEKNTNTVDPKRKYDKNITLPIIDDGYDKQLSITSMYSYRASKKKSVNDDYDPLKELQADDALLEEHLHDDVFYIPKKPKGTSERRNSITLKFRKRTDSDASHRSMRHRTTSESGVRPLYRDDIFFQASLHRLPQYKSYGSGLDYTLSVTRLPTTNDVEEEEEGLCRLCPEAMRRTLATMLDLNLLGSPSFMLFALAGFLTTMGMFTPFVYLADRGKQNGMDDSILLFLVSSIGITNTIGRIVCGALTMIPKVDSLMLNNIALTVGGIATIFSGISYSPSYQFFFAAVFGLSISFWASLRSIVAVDLLGLEKLTNAFGILLLFQGLAAVIGSPIAEVRSASENDTIVIPDGGDRRRWQYSTHSQRQRSPPSGLCMEMTGNYDVSFYLSGGLLLVSGVMCYPLMRLKKWEESRNESESAQDSV